mgnify:CR=1 FL=1
MTSSPASPATQFDDLLRGALAASRYAKRVLDAQPALLTTLDAGRAFTAEEMHAFVAAAGGYVFGVLAHYIMSSRIIFRHRFDLHANTPTPTPHNRPMKSRRSRLP